MPSSPETYIPNNLNNQLEQIQVDYDDQDEVEPKLNNINEVVNQSLIKPVFVEAIDEISNNETELEKSFIYSFELAPDQRLELRHLVNYLKDPKFSLNELIHLNRIKTPEILNSSYVQELVKSKYFKLATSDNSFIFPKPSELIDKFGIEENFFMQPELDEYRKQNWLQRIKDGIKLDDPNFWEKEFDWDEKRDEQTIEKKKKDEIIMYGDFIKSIPDPTLLEINKIAKEGLIRTVERDTSWRSSQSTDSAAIIEEYKNIFNITQEEFEQEVINQLKKNKNSYDRLSLLNADNIERLRQFYPFINDFIDSLEGKTQVHNKIEGEMIKGDYIDNTMKYYKLTSSDFDQSLIKEKRKVWEKQYIIDLLNNNSTSYLRLDDKVLEKNDWQEILSNESYREKIISYLSDRLFEFPSFSDEVVGLVEKIGLSQEEVNKIGSLAIIDLSSHRENFRTENIIDIKNKFGLMDDEYKKAFSLGVLDTISYNYHELANREERIKLKVEAELPEVQTKLKEIYYEQLADINLSSLQLIKEKFNIKWTENDRLNREKALKQALCDKFKLDAKFQKADQVEIFINEHLPDKKMAVYLYSDKEIKNSVKQMLVESALQGSSIFKDNRFVDEITKLFDVKDEAIAEIKTKVQAGEFIIFDKTCTTLFPEINVHEENIKCLANHGKELVEKSLENKNWVVLSVILENYSDTPTGQELKNFFAQQEENIKNDNKSPVIRTYAVESLAKVYQNNKELEDKYFSKLIHIFREADVSKLSDLFKRRSDKIKDLSEADRNLLFDTLITRASEVSQSNGDDSKKSILESKAITLLNKDQSQAALDYSRYEVIIVGIKQALNNQLSVPAHIYDNLYSRARDNEKKLYTKSSVEFVTAIEDLLKTNNNSLLQNQFILKELASKPESISIIKKLFELPSSLIANQWTLVYDHFKNLPDAQFENHVALLLRLNEYKSLIESIGIKIMPMFDKLCQYNQENQEQFFSLLKLNQKPKTDFTDIDWAAGIINYVSAAENANRLSLSESNKAKVLDTFNGSYKDVALRGMYQSWQEFLKTEDKTFLPPELLLVSAYIEDAGGAGNLKHIESLGNFAYQINNLLESSKTTKRTKDEIKKMLNMQEARISKEKWSQDDRSEFYNISHDIAEAAPSFYSSLSPLLEQLLPKEMKVFMTETLPLFQAQLITKQNIDGRDGEVSYDSRQLVYIRQTIKDMASEIEKNPEDKMKIFEREKNRLVEAIKESFKERFGILQVPNEFSKDNLRTVQNGIRYIGNINNRDAKNEAVIAMYLGLELNGKWGAFRQGQAIKPEEYLAEAQLKKIKPLIQEKNESYKLPLDIAGIPPEKAARFQELLQEDVSSSMVGNIQTVDVKLGNVKRNIEELTDPDIYNTEQDKNIMKLLQESGRLVGSVLAKTYAETQSKKIEFNEEEREVQKKLAEIYNINQWSTEKVKNLQDQIQPFSLVTNMVNKLKEEKVDENIVELHQRLQPSDNIIKLFKSLGEDFTQESGALALGKDLTYLESLLVKDENKITPEQKAEVQAYLGSIKEKMEDLESTLDKIKEYYGKVKKSTHLIGHELLSSRMADMEKVLYSQDSSAMIVSRLTKDLNLIIENMRQCLGCMRKEINNDTNLAFGDYNKFFIMNQTEKDKGSISDEIMFFVPTKTQDGQEEMSFVMDKIYGSKVPDVLISNITSVYKKYQAIKQEIPEAKMSITVSHEAMAGVGLNTDLLEKRLKNILPSIQIQIHSNDLIATIPKSSFSDNYIEFGNGGARSSGERTFSGVVIH